MCSPLASAVPASPSAPTPRPRRPACDRRSSRRPGRNGGTATWSICSRCMSVTWTVVTCPSNKLTPTDKVSLAADTCRCPRPTGTPGGSARATRAAPHAVARRSRPRVDTVIEFEERAAEGSVKEDDGGRGAVPAEICAQPIRPDGWKSAQDAATAGDRWTRKTSRQCPTRRLEYTASRPKASRNRRSFATRLSGSPRIRPPRAVGPSSWQIYVVVADEKVGRRGQRGEELPGERVLLRRPPVLADIAQDHDAIDIGPPVDGPEDRLLGRAGATAPEGAGHPDDQWWVRSSEAKVGKQPAPARRTISATRQQRRLAGLSVPNPIASLPSRPISQTPTSPSRPVLSRTSAAEKRPRPPGGTSPGRRSP